MENHRRLCKGPGCRPFCLVQQILSTILLNICKIRVIWTISGQNVSLVLDKQSQVIPSELLGEPPPFCLVSPVFAFSQSKDSLRYPDSLCKQQQPSKTQGEARRSPWAMTTRVPEIQVANTWQRCKLLPSKLSWVLF